MFLNCQNVITEVKIKVFNSLNSFFSEKELFMAQIKTIFKNELNQARMLKKSKMAVPKMQAEQRLSVETKRLTNELHRIIMRKDQYYGLNWLIGFEHYISLKKKSFNTNRHYSRGHVVSVELFGHFNRELTFIHPAIVLYDRNSSNILIAPISSSKFNDKDSLHIDITAAEGMKNDSGICLDLIRVIDKSRVVFQWTDVNNNNIKVPTRILDIIDATILKTYLPSKNLLLEEITNELEDERKKNEQLQLKIDELQKQIEFQQQK